MEWEVGFNIEDTWLYMGLLAKRVVFTGSYYMMIEAGSRNPSVKVTKGLGALLGVERTRFFEGGAGLKG